MYQSKLSNKGQVALEIRKLDLGFPKNIIKFTLQI